jgi:hypothetical protein
VGFLPALWNSLPVEKLQAVATPRDEIRQEFLPTHSGLMILL